MRRTKIVATLGPASDSEETLRGLIRVGVDVVRLNFSHGSAEEHQARVERVRRLAAQEGRAVAILQDLQGPKIRTGRLVGGGPVQLVEGASLTLVSQKLTSGQSGRGTAERVSTSYPALAEDVKPGDRILLDDGLLELRVAAVAGGEVRTEVMHGGPLGEHKGINLPGVAVSAPALGEKDLRDLALGLQMGVDYVALSFVREAEDLRKLRRVIEAAGCDTPIIAKLEKPEALDQLEEILEACEGVMVARGDLGVELSPEAVPIAQKRIIEAANRAAKPVITATQMLESMIEHPRPTRAEASDVANAIFDGTGALMLSEETAVGRFPLETIRTMNAIACQAEGELSHWGHRWARNSHTNLTSQAVAHAAVDLAEDLAVALIVAFTRGGATARYLAQLRPAVPILAFTPRPETYRRLALYWGVVPLCCVEVQGLEEMLVEVEKRVLGGGYAQPGQRIVLTGGLPVGSAAATNFLRVHTLPG
ncbi:MAG: pyruvate kinase [Coprothermobacterota bacterium]|nr:pyruvate kinase [Coprothermobacterota bacterium]